ncbi:hypothetical protein Glove_363g11 [Diversispora epigaea]|uniref:Uncharacterized protein n=1 Tax=Diversispora epigaea TaxID=1348612 RepID=A0A397HC25_9GLOM|nr:hypothetical protein Glove_363g11 [Diversispora epigaea]
MSHSSSRSINGSEDESAHLSEDRSDHLSENSSLVILLALVSNSLYIPNPVTRHLGPPPSDTNSNPHIRIVIKINNHQKTQHWIEKCQLWIQELYICYVFGIKLYTPKNERDPQG